MIEKIIQKSFSNGGPHMLLTIEQRDHCYYIEYEGNNLTEAIAAAEKLGYKTDAIKQTAYNGNGGHINLIKYGEEGFGRIISEKIKTLEREGLFYTLYIPADCTEKCQEMAKKIVDRYESWKYR